MIPAPSDVALPALPRLLDGPAMSERLAAVLGLPVAACRPRYARYKPATSCLLLYDVEVATGDGDRLTLPVSVTALTGGRSERLAAREVELATAAAELAARATVPVRHLLAATPSDRIDRSVGSSAGVAPGEASRPLPRSLLAALPDLDALVQVFPVDRKLRHLARAVDPATLGADGSGVSLVRYKPGRKVLLRYSRPEDAAPVWARVHGDGRAAERASWTGALRAAGVTTPPVVDCRPDLGIVVHAHAPGRRLPGLRRSPSEYGRWLGPVAAALAGLHAVPADGARPRDEAGSVHAAAGAVIALAPELGPAARRIAGDAARALEALGAPRALVHGDFYDDQVLVGEDGVVLIDFDELGLGHGPVDAANYAAHLLVVGLPEAAEEVVGAYERETGIAVDDRLIAGCALRLASGPFRRLEADWPEGVERRVALAAGLVGRRRTGTAPLRGRIAADDRPLPVDPDLPQLEGLRDGALASRAIGTALGRAVELCGVAAVRHKPGRRCVLRLEMRNGGRHAGDAPTAATEVLYGKTFASDRGPTVHATALALCESRAFGPCVALPVPVAWVPELRLLLQREVPGMPVAGRLARGDVALAEAIAEAVTALHGSSAKLSRRHGPEREIAILARRLADIATLDPDLDGRIARAAVAWQAALSRATGWRWRPAHRDFYHAQVVVDGHRLGVLDLDDAALSDPALDVANFAAHLELLALEDPRASGGARRSADAFVRRCMALDPDLDPWLVGVLEAGSLLRLAAIHRPRLASLGERGAAVLAGLVRGAEERLASLNHPPDP